MTTSFFLLNTCCRNKKCKCGLYYISFAHCCSRHTDVSYFNKKEKKNHKPFRVENQIIMKESTICVQDTHLLNCGRYHLWMTMANCVGKSVVKIIYTIIQIFHHQMRVKTCRSLYPYKEYYVFTILY